MARLQTLFYETAYHKVDLKDPRFEEADDIHDWRNHVGKYTRQIWDTLDMEQRAAIALDAEEKASDEEYD